MESYNLTEGKAKFSTIISHVVFARKNVTIRKKGKKVAVVVPYEDYIQKWAKGEGNRGLLSAKGALADMDGLDQFVEELYEAREKSTDRQITSV